MVFRRCQKLLKNESLAYEAMQDVFVQIIIKENELDLTTPSSLLYRIATNTCLNIIRKYQKEHSWHEHNSDDLLVRIATLEDIESQTHAARVLSMLFKRVPESSRTIAVLHLVDGLTLQEVAKEMNMSESGIRKRLRQLNQKLNELSDI